MPAELLSSRLDLPAEPVDLTAALAALPKTAGVAQLVARAGENLLVGRPANLRRWAATHLGALLPKGKGRRPPTNLRPVASAVLFRETTSGFHQRLVYERVMAPLVPLRARRDLRLPAFLWLDLGARFPRLTIGDARSPHAYGPFLDRRAAQRARDALHRLFPLRPCDYAFEPEPTLPLGLGCVYAQMRTCAAPCLARTGEDAYRSLAAEAASFLTLETRRGAYPEAVPPWVGRLSGCRAVVAERTTRGVELYAVREGCVLDGGSALTPEEGLAPALAGLRFDGEAQGYDTPWLLDWLRRGRRHGAYVVLERDETPAALAARVRSLL